MRFSRMLHNLKAVVHNQIHANKHLNTSDYLRRRQALWRRTDAVHLRPGAGHGVGGHVWNVFPTAGVLVSQPGIVLNSIMGCNVRRAERELAKPWDNCSSRASPLRLYLSGRVCCRVHRAGSEHPNVIRSSEGGRLQAWAARRLQQMFLLHH